MFTGYCPETVDFLWGIRMNNNREWFLAHKQDYVNYLYEPTKALGKKLFGPFLDAPGNTCHVSRIYRDARMHHALPYKESLWICIRPDCDWWAESPCLFFEINPEGVDYGFFFYKPKPALLKRFRQEIAAQPEKFLSMMTAVEDAAGRAVEAVPYKKAEPCPDPALERFYRWREQIGCCVHEDFSPDTFGPALAGRVEDFFRRVRPLYEYFVQYGA